MAVTQFYTCFVEALNGLQLRRGLAALAAVATLATGAFGAELVAPVRFNSPPRDFPIHGNPIGIVSVDLNGDNKQDLVVANSQSNDVSVLLANGNGFFRAAVNYAVDAVPQFMVTGDFNKDGKPDLAIACRSNDQIAFGEVTILLGKGDGTFSPGLNFPVGTAPLSMVVVDLNRDRKLDLVVANSGSNDLSVLLGNGDGTFQNATTIVVGSYPIIVVAGDFNGDGKTDLAVSNENSNTISVLLGRGDGTFRRKADYTVSFGARLVVGDFNADGNLDLLIPDPMGILIGQGDGTFRPLAPLSNDFYYYAVAGDFNGDGRLDLAGVNWEYSNGWPSSLVSVSLGNGDGTFQPATSYVVAGTSNTFVALGDFNGDGKLDLTVNGPGSPGFVSVLLGNGDGSFPRISAYPGNQAPATVVTADFNEDGKLDVVVANSLEAPARVSVLFGNGRGEFAAPFPVPVFSNPYFLAVGDFNSDGHADVVAIGSDQNNMSVLLGRGDGTFAPAIYSEQQQTLEAVAAADFNRDGKLDLAILQKQGAMYILLGNGDGTFRPATTVRVASGSGNKALVVGDFDQDGNPDIVIADGANGALVSLLGKGDGTFRSAGSFPAFASPSTLCLGDFNGDGVLDAASANTSDQSLSVFLGFGDGTFEPALQVTMGTMPYSVVAADFNGDGKTDLAAANFADNVGVLLNKGNGMFAPPIFYPSGVEPRASLAGDFNGDGRPDLVVVDREGTRNIQVLLNRTP